MINKDINERISITLNKETLAKLDELAKNECRNRSKQIEYLILNYLKNKK